MTQHWKEVIPVDHYIVGQTGLLHAYDRKVITLLYQPLIGALATSLYFTLWAEADLNDDSEITASHHRLMTMMQVNLEAIYRERLKLEGIGLLKTYVKKGEDDLRTFLYELQAPLTPAQFFYDGVLNVYLYNRIGKTAFHKLKQTFSEKFADTTSYEDITKGFHQAFSSVSSSELTVKGSEAFRDLQPDEGEEYIDRNKAETVRIDEETFDFELFLSGLSKAIIPRKAINKSVKEAIVKLAFVYRISPLDMQRVVMQALNPATDEIEIEALRKAARAWYQLEHRGDLPALSERSQPIATQTMRGKQPQTKEEELIAHLESISPYECLQEISNGGVPSPEDLRIVEDVMIKQKLPAGVVNVLLQYVMLKSDMKLSKSYVSKIASHWARKKIQTVSQAMSLAKEEHQKYQQWEGNKKSKQTSRKTIRKEKLPDWFKKEDAEQPRQQADESLDKMRKELEQELKNTYGKKRE